MSGSQIGGVVGGTIGFFVGYPQLGYAIGSAIGGYIDPVQVKGPRLTDAAQQTSSVGVPLPFGYGTFSTAGNVIWADELKEQVKRQRQGKGGGTKTTTYTYSRSYAIGVCEGPIYGYLIVKRNGKTVYNSDPSAPVADKDYSTKWLQRATLYYGDEVQLPDSTIEAVEGAGNVSAFRGLAYIVIENEDLTDLAGAVPQYEFIINASPPELYLTSTPYPVMSVDSIGTTVSAPGIQSSIAEAMEINSIALPLGRLSDILVEYTLPEESIDIDSVNLPDGRLFDQLVVYGPRSEAIDISSTSLPAGQLFQQLYTYNTAAPEAIDVTGITMEAGQLG